MKITGLRPIILQAPTEGLSWIGGRLDTWDVALVQVLTDEGVTGLGEVTQGANGAAAVAGIVEALEPFVLGQDPRHPRRLRTAMYNRTLFWARGGIAAGVLSAVEIASWDIAGKAAGLPVHQLLGGLAHDQLRVYASAGLGSSVPEVLENFDAQVRAGFDLIKVRALIDRSHTIDLLDALSDVIPPGVRILFDGVQGCTGSVWSFNDALTIGRRLADLDAVFFEEPFRAEDVESYRRLRARVDVPIAGAETYTSRREFQQLVDAEGADILQPDATIVGGLSELHAVADMAANASLATMPHTWGSAVTIAANWSAAFAHPDIKIIELNTYQNPLVAGLLTQPLAVHNGVATPSPAAGLGVEISDDIEQQYGGLQPGRGIFVA
jgi:L-alanine-DL-glutamate epimerase-like enolase superfamily enzyme